MDPSLVPAKIRAALGACRLGRWPTPLEPAAPLGDAVGLDALWVKREDRSSVAYGGNKVRGLEFLLGEQPPGTVFVTLGASGSTHCLATAVHARAVSGSAVVAQFPQEPTEASRAVAAACERAAAGVVRARTRAGLPLAVLRAWLLARRLGPRRWIPGGGAHPRAVVGHLLGGLELASQTAPPDAVVTPLGSGGTAAGLVLAFAALGWPTRVIAARVAPRVVANRWRVAALARGAGNVLAVHGISLPAARSLVPPLVVDCVGRGYGIPTREGDVARVQAAEHGLELDPTYGAKAFAVLGSLPSLGFRRVVFWHTFALP